jgi:hypothetical protein
MSSDDDSDSGTVTDHLPDSTTEIEAPDDLLAELPSVETYTAEIEALSAVHSGSDADGGNVNRLRRERMTTPTGEIVGLRAGESSTRSRKLDETGLHGESLGQPASFPLRDWSARDVWAYLVANDVPYPDHYDRLARSAGDGSPREYEQARFTTFFDPEFEALSGASVGVAEWRHRQ